jgi:hypothetical protein
MATVDKNNPATTDGGTGKPPDPPDPGSMTGKKHRAPGEGEEEQGAITGRGKRPGERARKSLNKRKCTELISEGS